MRKFMTIAIAAVIVSAAIGAWTSGLRTANSSVSQASAAVDPFALSKASKALPPLQIDNLF